MGHRLALLADIHGNGAALDAVLADLGTREHDAVALLGDYFLFGPRPREVFERLRDLDAPAIEGNTDRYIAEARPDHPFAELIAWNRAQLGDDGVAWLSERPFSLEDGSLLAVHANPRDLEDLLVTVPAPSGAPEPTDPAHGAALMFGVTADLTVYGHIHYFSSGEFGGRKVASIGSVGMPFDDDPRAAYAIAEWDGGVWTIHPRRVEYDHRSVADEVRAQATQLAEARAQRFERSRAIPLRDPE